MGEAAARYIKARNRAGKAEQRKKRSPEDRRALETMRREADKRGAELENDGEGGLPATLVLDVMRRDKYTCKRCNGKREKPITVHHKGGIVESEWLDKKGHKSVANNLVVLCTDCHDDVHSEAREEGVDSSQRTPSADKGDPKHDPDARKE